MEDDLNKIKETLTSEKHNVARLEGQLAAAHEAENTQRIQLEARINELNNMRHRLETNEAKYQDMSLQMTRMQAMQSEMEKEIEVLRSELIKARLMNDQLRKGSADQNQ